MNIDGPSEPLPTTGQPVGLPVADPSPAPRPGPVTLQGRFGSVEKLDPGRHGATLWEAIRGHEELWTYNGFGPFDDATVFARWLAERAKLPDPYYYIIIDTGGRSIGMLDSEWPARKLAFERWLAPENFSADGKQKISLAALNGTAP